MSEHVNDTADAGVITDIGNDVFQIDTRMAGYSGITAGYLIRSERPCLVETGTAPSAPVVRGALTALGIGPADLATIVVTHIHLDHAGGAGDLAAAFPGAEVVVHELGARHLADPSRLMASARMVYGGELDALFGSMAPTPAGRIRAVGRVGAVDLGGGRRLESHHSPGHAKHHVGLIDSASGDLYVGDAAGIYVPGTGDQRPATPPLFSHYGPVGAVAEVLDRAADELRVWTEETRRARRAGLDLDHAVAMVAERTRHRYAVLDPGADPAIAAKYDRISGAASNVAGIMRWLERAEPEDEGPRAGVGGR